MKENLLDLKVKEINLPPQFSHLEAVICSVSGKDTDNYTVVSYYNPIGHYTTMKLF